MSSASSDDDDVCVGPLGTFLKCDIDKVDAPLSFVEGYHATTNFELQDFPIRSKCHVFWSQNDSKTPNSILEKGFEIAKLDKKLGAVGYYPSTILAVAGNLNVFLDFCATSP